MITIEERKTDILKLVKELDISPVQHMKAINKYKEISNYLLLNGINADFYPQGSFGLGTVVKPYKGEEDSSFDFDAICEVQIAKNEITACELKTNIEKILLNSELYKNKIDIYDKCCTIRYGEIDGIEFSLDIVCAVPEDENIKLILRDNTLHPELTETAIAIAEYDKGYDWGTNNPKGFKEWFEGINDKFLICNPMETRKTIFESHSALYNSVEDVPYELQRTALQRVIQILKHHRDVYYSKKTDGNKIKPISAIITTIVSKIAENAPYDMNVFDLLKYVLDEFDIYAEHQQLNEAIFSVVYENKNVIKRIDGEWIIENPVNNKDNLADAWNGDDRIPKAFFEWASVVRYDILQSIEKSDKDFGVILESAFGANFTNKSIDLSKYTVRKHEQMSTRTHTKPWREII